MKYSLKYSGIFLLAILMFINTFAKPKKSDWQLGIQSYTFHTFTLEESITKAHQLGIKNIEAFYGQELGGELEGKMFTMDVATQKKLLAYAKSQNVNIIATGVVTHKTHDEWDHIFKDASAMGIKIITCEPEYDDLKYVDQLANKYKIDVAIHNHPKPSIYWTPELFINAVKGLSMRIGGCADIGHWKRMGIDPVEGIKLYGNRLKMVHLKDVEAKKEGKDYQDDVLPGTGVCNLDGIFQELKKENFKGEFSIEFEGDQDKLMPSVQKYVEYFNNKVSQLF